jgi:L-threonylcarbamoyladenylate synthase
MPVIKTSHIGAEAALTMATERIRAGGIVAFPTETFYALGVRYSDTEALERLFLMKHRPKDKPMPLIIGDVHSIEIVSPDPGALVMAIIGRLWPGPVTILLTARPGLPDFITGGSSKVAVRVPGRSFALDLARSVGLPITATSANISGMPPADNADEVARYFGKAVDLLVDGGRTDGGKPSTIIDVSQGGITLVRDGAVPYDEILEAAKGR